MKVKVVTGCTTEEYLQKLLNLVKSGGLKVESLDVQLHVKEDFDWPSPITTKSDSGRRTITIEVQEQTL